MDLSIINCDSNLAELKHLSGVNELLRYANDSKISWINICGLDDVNSIKDLGRLYNIHDLSIEDLLNTTHPPKIEIFDNYRFLSIKAIQRDKGFHHAQKKSRKSSVFFRKKKELHDESEEFLITQICIIIMKNTLITFQEMPGDSFDAARKKILSAAEFRKMDTDYLAYNIIDAIVDEYSLAFNHLEEDIENFEDRATKTSDYTFIEEIQATKKYLLQIKRAISPVKDNIEIITRHKGFFQKDESKPMLQDLNEHLNHSIITVENYREWLTNIMDVNLSVLTYQMNKVMKVLAIISTIFIPLTFIAGVYGMNFDYMPELRYKIAYPIALGGMGLIALTMVMYFKIRRWF